MHKSKIDIAVLLIFFNRDVQFGKVFEQVKLARPSKLYLYQDGARANRPDDVAGIERCRAIAEDIDWECEVHRLYQEKNFGCDPSEYIAQKWMFETEEYGIILEDDDVPSQSFFPFCKELLEKYKDDTRIHMICGMNNNDVTECPYSYFFAETGSIWGWASWKRVIDTFDAEYKFLDDPYAMARVRERCADKKEFDAFIALCKRHKATGRAHYESILGVSRRLYNRINIVPTKNMITNIGVGCEGTHAAADLNHLPKSIRNLFHKKRYEVEFPLVHPPYILVDKSFDAQLKAATKKTVFSVFGKVYRLLRYSGVKRTFDTIKKKLFR